MAALDGTITITSSEYRPCYVYGMKALFHRWVEKEKPIIQINALLNDKDISKLLKKAKEGVIPNGANMIIQKETFAIIEYGSGMVAEVEPSKIVFADDKIKEYAFPTIGGKL